MIIYRVKPQFDPNSGKPTDPVKEFEAIRCDVTGEVLDFDNDWAPHVALNYGTSDPCFGSSTDEFDFGQEFEVDMHEFLSDPYAWVNDGGDALSDALTVAAQALDKGSSLPSVPHFLRSSRVETARKLIAEGTITADQLKPE